MRIYGCFLLQAFIIIYFILSYIFNIFSLDATYIISWVIIFQNILESFIYLKNYYFIIYILFIYFVSISLVIYWKENKNTWFSCTIFPSG